MFCPKCGKKNEDSSLFCTWCGAGFSAISTQSLNKPEGVPQPSNEEKVLQTVPAAPAEHVEPDSSSTTVSPVATAEHAEPVEPVQLAEPASPAPSLAPSLSIPGVIPQSSDGSVSSVESVESAPEKAAQDPSHLAADVTVPVSFETPKAKASRSYTAAHLAICLVVAGIMAAAAGVFAGLYFSTIL